MQVLLVIYWVICSGLAIMAVNVHIQRQQQASTVVRKYFHVLAVAVFIPGLIRECCFLYLASGVVLAVITALEVKKYLRHCCILRECEFVQMYGIVRCGVLS
jgi:dolichol kinase